MATKSQNQQQRLTRRGFLRGASLFGVGSAVAALADRSDAQPQKSGTVTLPSGYDLDRLKKTDPALIHYEQVSSISTPEPKRILVLDERLIVASGKNIFILGRQGAKLSQISGNEDFRAIAFGPKNTLYAATRSAIHICDSAGQKTATWESPAKNAWFTSLAVGASDLFAADAGNRIVWHYDTAGKLLGRLGEKNKDLGISGFLIPSPYFDLKIGSDGLLWVANPGYHRVEAYSFDGRLKSQWGEPSFGISGFCGCCNPSYFARLADGRFVTSEKGLVRVKVYSAKGEFESVVASPEAFPKYFENPNATPESVDVAADSAGRIFVADSLGNAIRVFQRKKA